MHGHSSGISVVEIPPRGQAIPAGRAAVAAFIGPAPRGPADIPIAVRSLDEFLTRFGVPGYLSRMEFLLHQFFENGGEEAIVVRVCRTGRRNRLVLPGPAGELALEARYPGPLEHLRASVDHEGVASDRRRFNLVIHRCRSPAQPLVEEQEVYTGVSVAAGDPQYLGDLLAGSALVRLAGPLPAERPTRTVGAGQGVDYVWSGCDWRGDNTPTDYDLIGARDRSTGLFALDQVPVVDFVTLVPGATGASLGPVALFAGERYCRERQALLIVDPPESWRDVDDVIRVQRERGFASPSAVTYFPPLESSPHGGPGGHLSAAGAIAGVLAAAGLGLARPPFLVLGRSRPTLALESADAHHLGRLGVNVLMRVGGRVELAGLVTMSRSAGASRWNALRQRRIALFVLGSLLRYTRWSAFEAGHPALWQDLRCQVQQFLETLQSCGLLAGDQPHEGSYVKCDADTQPSGQSAVGFIIGLALERPGHFQAFEVIHSVAGSTVRELAWQPGLALAG